MFPRDIALLTKNPDLQRTTKLKALLEVEKLNRIPTYPSIVYENKDIKIKVKKNLLPRNQKSGTYSLFLRQRKLKQFCKRYQFTKLIEMKKFNKYKYSKFLNRIERKSKFKRSFALSEPTIELKYKPLNLAHITVKHSNINTFISIRKYYSRRSFKSRRKFASRVIYKDSAGNAGFKGPKKRTSFSRMQVFKIAGEALAARRISFLHITTNSKVYKWQRRKMIKDLISRGTYYLTNVSNNYRRAHGFIRHKKKKRL